MTIMMMKDLQRKQKPSVMITTYSCSNRNSNNSNNSNNNNNNNNNQSQVNNSTNLFSINYIPGENDKNSLLQQAATSNWSQARLINDLSFSGALNQIKGPSGSVRGHKDVVKKSLENIKSAASNSQRNFTSSNLPTFMPTSQSHNLAIQHMDELHRIEYLNDLINSEENQCVLYTTTLGVIRRTFEDSKLMRSILNLNLIRYEERDVYLNQEYKHQLRLRCKSILVPSLFVEGKLLGGTKELEMINESGNLLELLAKFKMSEAPKDMCLCCGNARFIACQQCNGSRKSMIRHFKFNSIALRCIKCDKNDGLVQCPTCCGKRFLGGSSFSKLKPIDEVGVDSNNNHQDGNTNNSIIK